MLRAEPPCFVLIDYSGCTGDCLPATSWLRSLWLWRCDSPSPHTGVIADSGEDGARRLLPPCQHNSQAAPHWPGAVQAETLGQGQLPALAPRQGATSLAGKRPMATAAQPNIAIPPGHLEGFRDLPLHHTACLALEGERGGQAGHGHFYLTGFQIWQLQWYPGAGGRCPGWVARNRQLGELRDFGTILSEMPAANLRALCSHHLPGDLPLAGLFQPGRLPRPGQPAPSSPCPPDLCGVFDCWTKW